MEIPRDFNMFDHSHVDTVAKGASNRIRATLAQSERKELARAVVHACEDLVGSVVANACLVSEPDEFASDYDDDLKKFSYQLCYRLGAYPFTQRLFGGPISRDSSTVVAISTVLDLVVAQVTLRSIKGSSMPGKATEYQFQRRLLSIRFPPAIAGEPWGTTDEYLVRNAMSESHELVRECSKKQLPPVGASICELLVERLLEELISGYAVIALTSSEEISRTLQMMAPARPEDGTQDHRILTNADLLREGVFAPLEARPDAPKWFERPSGTILGMTFVHGGTVGERLRELHLVWADTEAESSQSKSTMLIPADFVPLIRSSDNLAVLRVHGHPAQLGRMCAREFALRSGIVSLFDMAGSALSGFWPAAQWFDGSFVIQPLEFAYDIPGVVVPSSRSVSTNYEGAFVATETSRFRIESMHVSVRQEDLDRLRDTLRRLGPKPDGIEPVVSELLACGLLGSAAEACRLALNRWAQAETKSRAIRRDAVDSIALAECAMDYMSVVEILLSARGSTTEKIASRVVAVARFLSRPELGVADILPWTSLSDLSDNVKKLYGTRSAFVHAGISEWSLEDVWKVRRLGGASLLACLALFEETDALMLSDKPSRRALDSMSIEDLRRQLDSHVYETPRTPADVEGSA